MNIIEMFDLAKKIYEKNVENYEFIGIRFEDKEREIGETCEYSRHNPDREDERDFPEYGTNDYFEMEELEGTSVCDLSFAGSLELPMMAKFDFKKNIFKDCSYYYFAEHCYIVAGNDKGIHDDPDQYEILIKDAVVLEKIF